MALWILRYISPINLTLQKPSLLPPTPLLKCGVESVRKPNLNRLKQERILVQRLNNVYAVSGMLAILLSHYQAPVLNPTSAGLGGDTLRWWLGCEIPGPQKEISSTVKPPSESLVLSNTSRDGENMVHGKQAHFRSRDLGHSTSRCMKSTFLLLPRHLS